MDYLLQKITQNAVNYAIRSTLGYGVAYLDKEGTKLFKTVDDSKIRHELKEMQERLDGKIRIISPAIDMIELISARGNNTLESAGALTKSIRWDIQSLGLRCEKANASERAIKQNKKSSKLQAEQEIVLHEIIQAMKSLLSKIEDAVPLINLAIATSGASLSTTLPNSVSPSRLMQASTILTYGDGDYCKNPSRPAQVGPTLTLSLYMLFAGHTAVEEHERPYRGNGRVGQIKQDRDMTWKEVMHKAQIKLVRVPLHSADSNVEFISRDGRRPSMISDTELMKEYAYQIQIIEDLDDGRVHDFEDHEAQPGSYGGVDLAGIREVIPLHQISKIFYADTGKILNIGNPSEANSPVLLLKRDVNALPPNRMMGDDELNNFRYNDTLENPLVVPESAGDDSDQDDVDQQLRRESSAFPQPGVIHQSTMEKEAPKWRFPPDLDTEWLALEVYTESLDSGSETEEGDEESLDNLDAPSPQQSTEVGTPNEEKLTKGFRNLTISPGSPSSRYSPKPSLFNQLIPTPKPRRRLSRSPSSIQGGVSNSQSSAPHPGDNQVPPSTFGHIQTSLSLLEMLIRLMSLQQFQQVSHLSIPDQFVNFFLTESNTDGGVDAESRRRHRWDARRKMGFDPYDESPVKHHGEEYQYQHQEGYASPGGQSQYYQEDYERYPRWEPDSQSRRYDSASPSPRWPPPTIEARRHYTPEPWLSRPREMPSSRQSPSDMVPQSPESPYKPTKKSTRPLQRVMKENVKFKGSPLGRGMSVETDSTLGTSPGSPTLIDRAERVNDE